MNNNEEGKNIQKIKPYFFILVIFLLPVLLIPVIKYAKSKQEQTLTLYQPIIKQIDTTYALAIIGGVGGMKISTIPDSMQASSKAILYGALELGKLMLQKGDSAHLVTAKIAAILKNNKIFEQILQNSLFRMVGCVACDKYGNMWAVTDIAETNNKNFHYSDDSFGKGIYNWTDNELCAVSCVGLNDKFTRIAAAHEVTALMRYKKLTLKQAAFDVIRHQVADIGGYGALVAVDKMRNIIIEANTPLVFHAYCDKFSNQKIALEIKY